MINGDANAMLTYWGKKTEGLSNLRDLSPLFVAWLIRKAFWIIKAINPALGVCSYHLHFTPPLGFFLGTRNDESGTPSKHCPRAPARLHLLLLTYSLYHIKSLNTKTSSHFMNQRQNKVFNDMHPRANLGSLWNFRFFNLYKSFHFSRATAALK